MQSPMPISTNTICAISSVVTSVIAEAKASGGATPRRITARAPITMPPSCEKGRMSPARARVRNQRKPGRAEQRHHGGARRAVNEKAADADRRDRAQHLVDADMDQEPDEEREPDQRRNDDTDLHDSPFGQNTLSCPRKRASSRYAPGFPLSR